MVYMYINVVILMPIILEFFIKVAISLLISNLVESNCLN